MNLLEQLQLEEWKKRAAELVAAGRLKTNADGSAEYTLAWPVRDPVENRELTQLTIRRPKAKDLQKLDKVAGDVAKTRELVVILTGLDPVAVGELDAEDYVVCAQVAGDFIEGRRLTGPTPSA